MNLELLEEYESLVVEMGNAYLNNMESELGKKYKKSDHDIYPGLTAAQFMALKTNHNIADNELNEVYSEFLKLEPTSHLKKLLDAFHASGGNIDIEPSYDENAQSLHISVHFVIKDNTLENIEGLSPIEGIVVKMNAMLQVDAALSGSDPDMSPTF